MNKSFEMNVDKTREGYLLLNVRFLSSDNSKEMMSSSDLQTFFIMYDNFTQNCQLKGIKFGQYFDITTLQDVSIAQFEMVAAFFKKQYQTIASHCNGSCIKVSGDFAKRMFSLFLKFYEPIKPITTVQTYEQACEFLDDCRDDKYSCDTIINNST